MKSYGYTSLGPMRFEVVFDEVAHIGRDRPAVILGELAQLFVVVRLDANLDLEVFAHGHDIPRSHRKVHSSARSANLLATCGNANRRPDQGRRLHMSVAWSLPT